MDRYEYKIVPAPTHGTKKRGAKKPEQKFALTIETVMNDMAAEGWEFQRSETLPHEHRTGLTGRTVTQRSVLVFRRAVVSDSADETDAVETPELVATKTDEGPAAAPAPEPDDKFFAGGKFRQ